MTPDQIITTARRAALQRVVERVDHLAHLQAQPDAQRPPNGDFTLTDRRTLELDRLGPKFSKLVAAAVTKAGGDAADVERVAVAALAGRKGAFEFLFQRAFS
jgi:hypothetical protein